MNEQETPLSDEPIEAAPPRALFDPYAGSRDLPWMDRGLSPSARAARRMRPELKGFAAIEGREPNGADLDDMAARITGEMVEISRREWAADIANEWLEEKDAAREGRPVDPPIGPKAQPIGGDPRDTRRPAMLSLAFSLPPRSGGSAPVGGEGGHRPATEPPPPFGHLPRNGGGERRR